MLINIFVQKFFCAILVSFEQTLELQAVLAEHFLRDPSNQKWRTEKYKKTLILRESDPFGGKRAQINFKVFNVREHGLD